MSKATAGIPKRLKYDKDALFDRYCNFLHWLLCHGSVLKWLFGVEIIFFCHSCSLF